MITNETEQDVTIPSTCVIAELGAFHCILSQHNVISANESTENKTQLSFDFSDSPISQKWKERITKQLADIPEVFAFHDLDFGCTSKVKHSIKLHDPTPFKHRARPIHPQDLEAVRKHLQELLAAGVIRESQSPYSSPIVVVRKRNNDVRLCIDFRKLNLQTQKDSYALPNLEETFSALSGSKWFTVLDLKSGYYQIEVEEADKEKTAFVTPLGFWEFNRMPQGITNAPSTFQRLMERCVGDMNLHEVLVFLDDLIIFSDSLEEHERRLMRIEVEEADKEKTAFVTPLGFWEFNRMPQGITNAPSTFQRLMERCVGDMNLHEVLVFLDDLIIFSDSLEEHERRLMRVLHRLKEYGLKLSPEKCKFFQTTVRYLGHIISESGVETDPEKIQALKTWPRPKNLKELRSFLGFSGYYRRFIKGYSSIVRPLNDLTRGYPPLRKKSKSKDTDQTYFDPKLPFESRWTTDCQKAFDSIIGKLTSAPILGFADPKLPYVLHTDASTTGLGAALYQEQEGQLRAIAFASRGLSRSEARYPAHKLEFLALKWELNRLEIHNEVLYRKRQDGDKVTHQLVLPEELRAPVLQSLHNDMGHLGTERTLDLARTRFYWPRMARDVEQKVKKCDRCIRRKSSPEKAASLVNITTTRPLELVCMDFLMRKRNNDVRLCIDFRKLNLQTQKDSYALPNLEETFSALSGSKWFTVLDLKSGYYQIEVEEADKEKTAFVTPLGFWEFNRMPQGITNAPSTFQRLMERCVGDMNLHEVLVFLDDLIIFSDSLEEHERRLMRVLHRLKEYGLKLSPKKCKFFQTTVRYLGHIISESGVETDPEKIQALETWPRPKNLKELRSFLGFSGYYRRFIKGYSSIVRPLNDLTRGYPPLRKKSKSKDTDQTYFDPKLPFESRWTTDCQKAFDSIIGKLTSAPILGFADPKLPYVLHTDASTTGLGAALYQEQEGRLRAIAFASRGLSRSEARYPAHKLEFLALKWELNRLEIHNEVLYRKRQDGDKVTHQLVLPEELRAPVLKSLHNDMGHLGTERTLDLARTRFYWPRMATDVEQKVKKCDRCIRRKSSPEKAASLVNITTTRPLELVCMDFLSLEPDSSNTSNILVMTDHFTKFAFALPTPNQKSKTVARCLWDQFIVHYGIPERLHSDQGPDFEAKLIKDLLPSGNNLKHHLTGKELNYKDN
ncbi:Retrovirus-related Pol polyprotein from transposon 412 [Labeo rohita]|uniref:Gypsy retrotransposon integrase-like protein 1 n=1 Tax=Labeo rohita TaxID=84645 RepID=A0A498L6J4_LABRO|nr:Retrovirus-related Pol polyprotein from transposon 412 [Labeo rohita]